MAMDIVGKGPRSEAGKRFCNNVWVWRPLASYCCDVAPEIAQECEHWQTNQGDGLDDAGAVALANVLEREIESGRTASHERRFRQEQEIAPNEPCQICAATGIRLPVPHAGAGDPNNGGFRCNGCEGAGYVRARIASYGFSVENVKQFASFLRDSGGFEIW
jgi:hypothetical protein